MTRKSAKYIGKQCQELSKELERKTRWLTKKINRKLRQTHYNKIYDSYYDINGLYLIFKAYTILKFPYRPPRELLVNINTVLDEVSDVAMVNRDYLKTTINVWHKNTECFTIYIPFQAYKE